MKLKKVKVECHHCSKEYFLKDLEWSEGDDAYECPNCGSCYFAIITKIK